jgi:eukaryotic-like serine/threonine-protein kinase
MALQPGATLGPYEIVSLIGAGGMGEVYRARDPRLNREVAIKVLPADRVADPDRRRRFVTEAKAAAALNHPHIVTMHEFASADGIDFLVMEYVRGKSLDELIPRHGFRLGETLRIAIAVADALAAAHAHGILHRDLKPSNVAIGHDGAVKVLDFGLAKLRYDDSAASSPDGATRTVAAQTEPGRVVGTLAYMAPEQAAGGTTDARSDIFSFGALLYEMATGQRAFAGKSSEETLERVLQATPTPPSTIVPTLPPDLERVILRCLRKDPARRFQTMADLKVDLLEIKETSDAGFGLRSPSAQTLASPKRFWTTAGIVMALVAALSGIAGWMLRGSMWQRAPTPQRLVPRTLTRLTVDTGIQTDVTWSPDGRSIAYASDKAGNFDIWVQRIDGGDAVQITKSAAQDREPTWSPDGNTIVFRSDRDGGGLFVVAAAGGAERRLTPFGFRPKWAPDGSQILFASTDSGTASLYTVGLNGGPPHQVLQAFLRGLKVMVGWNWFPDSRQVSVLGAHSRQDYGVHTVPLSGGPAAVLKWTPELGGWEAFAWISPTTLFVNCDGNTIGRFTVDPSAMRVLAADRVINGDSGETRFALSPDGRRLAFAKGPMSRRLWALPFNAMTGRVTGDGEPVSDGTAEVGASDLTRDGTKLAYLLYFFGSDRVALWLTDLLTHQSRELARDDQERELARWSRDGNSLAYRWERQLSSGATELGLGIRRTDTNEDMVITTPRTDRYVNPSDWSPDDLWVLASSGPVGVGTNADLGLWPLAAAPHAETAVRMLTQEKDWQEWQASFSPDGRWICFNGINQIAADGREPGTSTIFVMPSAGGDRAHWTPLTAPPKWADKPRWSPDGKLVYFVQRDSFWNVWAVRFDSAAGRPIGAPFQVTQFDSPRFQISPLFEMAELGVSAHRLVLTMMEQSSNIWMVDNVDR